MPPDPASHAKSSWADRVDAACPHLNHVALALVVCCVGLVGCVSELSRSGSIASIAIFASVCGLGIVYLLRTRRRARLRRRTISDRVPRYFYF